MQADIEVDPAYVPAAHATQTEAAAAEYVPVWQALQDVEDVDAAIVPLAQLVQAEAPDDEEVPVAQTVQAEPSEFTTVPVREVYRPAAQLEHVCAPLPL